MVELRHRKTAAHNAPQDDPLLPTDETRKPLSTDKVRAANGLTYTREDQSDFGRVAKTALVTIVVALLAAYFFFQTYHLVWDFAVDYFLYTDVDWVQYAMRTLMLFMKGVAAYAVVVYLNAKLLLQYDDEDELDKYN